MKPQLYASAYERLRGEAAWSLLTAHLAPVVLALLQHLLYANERVLPASVLIERLHTGLESCGPRAGPDGFRQLLRRQLAARRLDRAAPDRRG